MFPIVFSFNVSPNQISNCNGIVPDGGEWDGLLEKIQNESSLPEDFFDNEDYSIIGYTNGIVEIIDTNGYCIEKLDVDHIVNYV